MTITISHYAARDRQLDLPAATLKATLAWALLPSAVLAIRTRVCAPASNLAKSIDVLRLPEGKRINGKGRKRKEVQGSGEREKRERKRREEKRERERTSE